LDTAGERLELLKDMMPKLSRAAVLWDPQRPGARRTWWELELPAKTLGVQLQSLEVRNVGDFDKAFADAVQGRAEALFIFPNPLNAGHQRQLAALAEKHRLPSIFHLSLANS